MISTLAVAALASIAGVSAQNTANNVTSLQGTWSTGNGVNTYITTGGDFCNPGLWKFNAPQNSGLSYSFTDDGFWEEAQFQFDANPSNPGCIAAKLIFQHGQYTFDGDALVLTPWEADGRIQVQNRCTGDTTQIYYYKNQIRFRNWGISVDQSTAQYALRLNAFDGRKLPPMYQVFNPPQMLPTEPLTGLNSSGQANTRKRGSYEDLHARSTGAGSMRVSDLLIGTGTTAAVMAVLVATSVF